MTATLTQVVQPLQQDWTSQREPAAILAACHGIAYQWREHTLHPVTTRQLLFVQMLHGNTACTHLPHLPQLNVTASAYCQARMKLPLTGFEPLLRSVSDALPHHPLDEGHWLGHRTFWVDGASFAMPNTPALHEHCGQPRKQLPGGGCPVAPLFALLHAGSGLVLQILAPPCPPMISPQWLDSIQTCTPGMSWSPTAAVVPRRIWPCGGRPAGRPSSAGISNTS